MRRASAVLCVGFAAIVLIVSSVMVASAMRPSDGTPAGHSSGPTYNVTFSETGLPGGTSWAVQVASAWGDWGWHHGETQSSTSPSFNISLPNGTYVYRAEPPLGFVTREGRGFFNVSGGSPPAIRITFTPLVTYLVTFDETGLPAGTNWTVTVFGGGFEWRDGWAGGWDRHVESNTSNTSTITFLLSNGTYRYSVAPVPGYVSNDSWGWFRVNGSSPAPNDVKFSRLVTYTVTFSESGLPAGTNWTVIVFGGGYGWDRHLQRETSNTSTITFLLSNGSYGYFVSEVPGFVADGSWGWFAVDGASPPIIDVTFSPVVSYAVTFSESGLPAGTNWSVKVFGFESGGGGFVCANATSSSTTIALNLPNGNYSYQIERVPGWQVTGGEPFGQFNVNGASPPEISVEFAASGSS
jgi:hypothetical protein